jgi:serine/threonine protein kinase
MEFAGELSQHRILQVCRRSQLSYHLPYRWGTWEELFTEQHFLAKGANGAVYRTAFRPAVAREFDTPAARGPIAVKVIQKNTIFSLRKWSHIQRELDTLRLCRNPHVIELIGVFQSPDAVYIILEFAQGGDLFDWLVARRKPKEAEVRAIAVQLLGTIFLMHERFGVVHRDIKPENILLKQRCRGSEEPHLKFADFGFARRYPVKTVGQQPGHNAALLAAVASSGVRINNNNHSTTNANNHFGTSLVGSLGANGSDSFDPGNFLLNATPCGTLGFAPPEVIQAYNARKADPIAHSAAPSTQVDTLKKMDIFALGVTLAILLTGQEPFPVQSSRAHMEAVARGVNFNTRPWQYVSTAAKQLIRKMLAAKSEDRPHALECLRSEWFEGTSAASSFLSRSMPPPTQQETEEDVRTFQKSVRSLRSRPGMVYVQNKDGTGVSMNSRAQAKMQEEEHIAAEENLGDGDDAIKLSDQQQQQPQSINVLSGGHSIATPNKGILKNNNNNNNGGVAERKVVFDQQQQNNNNTRPPLAPASSTTTTMQRLSGESYGNGEELGTPPLGIQ